MIFTSHKSTVNAKNTWILQTQTVNKQISYGCETQTTELWLCQLTGKGCCRRIYFTDPRNGYCQRVETKYNIRSQHYAGVILSLHFVTPTIAFRTTKSMLPLHILILLINKKLIQYELKMWTVELLLTFTVFPFPYNTLIP